MENIKKMLIKLIPKKTFKKKCGEATEWNEKLRNCDAFVSFSFMDRNFKPNGHLLYQVNGKVQFILFIYSFFYKSSRKFEASARKNMNTRRIQSEMDGWMDEWWVHQTNSERKEKGKKNWRLAVGYFGHNWYDRFSIQKTTDMITRKTN